MSDLIDDLLVYSRLGRSALRLPVLDLQSMVHDTRSLLDANAHAENPGHAIRWKHAPMPALAGADNLRSPAWLHLPGPAVTNSARTSPAASEISHAHEAATIGRAL